MILSLNTQVPVYNSGSNSISFHVIVLVIENGMKRCMYVMSTYGMTEITRVNSGRVSRVRQKAEAISKSQTEQQHNCFVAT